MSRLTYISLFSSAGVGCYGFKQNGFECVATNELLPVRLDVQRANAKCRRESGYIEGDITTDAVRQALREEIARWEREEGLEQVDVVFATPPCQGMSTVNYKKSDHEQVRNSLVVEAIRLIKEIRPKVFVFENVRAFMKSVCTDVTGCDMTISDSIYSNLAEDYNIYSKVINFKDYGVPSSRPRTIVIGTQKSLLNISPLNLFPTRRREITVREAIGDLAPLGFAERDGADPLHFARPYPDYMLPWIENLAEGQSSFSNPDETKPYKMDCYGNRVILKGAYMGNKYRRLYWDRPCACIATRNDQLASQDTIHPRDPRVLSIRELMRLMTIPDTFRWSDRDDELTADNAGEYLRTHELNIRRCIGEAVPTRIIDDIAGKIKTMLAFEEYVKAYYAGNAPEPDRTNFYIDTFLLEQEQGEAAAKKNGVFYTPQSVVFNAVRSVVPRPGRVRILEPSVGLGAFLPQVCSLFSDCDEITVDAVEIDLATVARLRESLARLELGCNVRLNFIVSDFLEFEPEGRYDYIFTNPPYAKSAKPYKEIRGDRYKTKNLFALFMVRFHGYADDIVCVIPKNFLMADDFEAVRRLYQDFPIVSVCDFGVRYFRKVFIEILSIHFSSGHTGTLRVTDFVNGRSYEHPQGYIYHDRLWLIYRNGFFDDFISRLELGCFSSFRDRQITNPKLSSHGRVRVLRSKNILDDGSIADIPGYDRYIDDPTPFKVASYLGSGAIIMPSFTYNTRATLLPPGTIPNGSIAVLTPLREGMEVDLPFYATTEFREYYGIVKSYSRFTLNIDNCSLYYIGIRK